MEEYKELPLWKAAYRLCRDVETLTRDFPEYTTLIRFLREKAAALPLAVAAVYATSANRHALKRAYEQAHDVEYVLFFSLIFRYLPYADTRGLFDGLYNVKRLIVEELKGPYGGDQAAPVRREA